VHEGRLPGSFYGVQLIPARRNGKSRKTNESLFHIAAWWFKCLYVQT
jgi:hypothetical protein